MVPPTSHKNIFLVKSFVNVVLGKAKKTSATLAFGHDRMCGSIPPPVRENERSDKKKLRLGSARLSN